MSCGPGRLGDKLVPDGPWSKVCEKHDLAYKEGGSKRDRRRADLQMLSDMIHLVAEHEHNWLTTSVLVVWALTYFLAVRWFGWMCWNKENK